MAHYRGVVPRPVVWTIVVAGGSGFRFGGPKQFELLGSVRVIDRSVTVAQSVSDGVVVVVAPELCERERSRFPGAIVVAGGESRSASVRAGIAAVTNEVEILCIQDAARPFASAALYAAVIDAVVSGADGAIPGILVADTIKVVDDDGRVVATPERSKLRAVQTPQAFRAAILRAAHAAAGQATDDAALVEAIGGHVQVVPGEGDNRKITVPDDLVWASRRVARPNESEI
jgi:2-C-methyl-D-erythritol 4-phosphate cytidylyltransferase